MTLQAISFATALPNPDSRPSRTTPGGRRRDGGLAAVYLSHLTGPGTAAAGYAAFSLAMAGGRFAGDKLRGRLGSVALGRWGGLIAAAGLGAGLLSGGVTGALIGFACAGAGFSTIFPTACSAAGRKALAYHALREELHIRKALGTR